MPTKKRDSNWFARNLMNNDRMNATSFLQSVSGPHQLPKTADSTTFTKTQPAHNPKTRAPILGTLIFLDPAIATKPMVNRTKSQIVMTSKDETNDLTAADVC